MKHTKGPWKVIKDETGISIVAQSGYLNWTVTLVGVDEELETDAHLMAAAPELLEALEGLLRNVVMVDGALEIPTVPEQVGAARDIVAKAKGREQ